MVDTRYRSRKFLIAVLLVAAGPLMLMWYVLAGGKLDAEVLRLLFNHWGVVAGLYFAGNAAHKAAERIGLTEVKPQ